ncbi:MAG: hypothetical protein ABSF15_25750 [Candidatus Sulfotelmatobacter sp.]
MGSGTVVATAGDLPERLRWLVPMPLRLQWFVPMPRRLDARLLVPGKQRLVWGVAPELSLAWW